MKYSHIDSSGVPCLVQDAYEIMSLDWAQQVYFTLCSGVRFNIPHSMVFPEYPMRDKERYSHMWHWGERYAAEHWVELHRPSRPATPFLDKAGFSYAKR